MRNTWLYRRLHGRQEIIGAMKALWFRADLSPFDIRTVCAALRLLPKQREYMADGHSVKIVPPDFEALYERGKGELLETTV